MKKIGVLIATVILMMLFVVSANAEGIVKSGNCGDEGDNVSYTLYDDGILVISGEGNMDNYTTGNRSPFRSTIIETIVIEEGVTSVGDYAFAEFKNLSEVILSNTVKTIGANAFYDCRKLLSINIPNSVNSIKYRAFYSCEKLSNITSYNNFSSLTILEDDAFSYTAYYNDASNWENDVLYVGNSLIEAKQSIVGNYNVKEGTVVIADKAFYSCSEIENIIVPASVTYIGYNAFLGVSYITVDDNNLNYSSDKFGVLFNKDKTILVQYPTVNSRTSYTLPDGVVEISDDAFRYCSALKNINLSDNLNFIGKNSFHYCESLSDITLPFGLEIIEGGAFAGCGSLTNLDLPNSLISIGEVAFGACSSLTSITVPQSITIIKEGTFSYCSNLSDIKLHSNIKAIETDAFKNVAYDYDESGVLYVDKYCVGVRDVYRPKDNYEIKEGTIGIANDVFNGNQELYSIVMPDSLKFIGDRAFKWCWGLNVVSFGKNVETIGCEAFSGNYNMKGFNIPDSVVYIGYSAFKNCEDFKTNSIGKNVKIIGNETFFGCGFVELIIPNGVTNIGKNAFSCCTDLKIVHLPNTVENIQVQAFESTNLKDVFFNGYESDWETIKIHSSNDDLLNANIHFLHEHLYNNVITNPTCTTQGYTTYTCECGDTYIDDYIKELGHSFTNYISDGKATCSTNGLKIAKCDNCDATDSIVISGDHSFSDEWTIDIDPTCKEEGMKSHHCKYCPARKDFTPIGKLAHDFVTVRVEPTCLDEGCTITACKCGEEIIEPIAPTGHDYDGSKCKICDYDRADDCSCNCHKGGIMGFLWKIINFFNKLFKSKQYCGCGAKHW